MIGTIRTNESVRYDVLRFSPSKFARLLDERDISSYALAKQMDVSSTWMQNLLNGKINLPREKYLRKLAQALKVHYSELLVEDEEAEKEPQALHENGVEYEIARQFLPNTDPERLSELIGYWVQMTIPDHEEMIDEARKRLPPVEDVGE